MIAVVPLDYTTVSVNGWEVEIPERVNGSERLGDRVAAALARLDLQMADPWGQGREYRRGVMRFAVVTKGGDHVVQQA